MLQELFQDATLIQSVGSVVAIILTFFARKALNEVVDEKRMNKLHTAVKSAVVNALSGRPDMALDELREFVAEYLSQSIPHTMKKLMPKLLERLGVPHGVGRFVTNEVLDPILTTLVNRYRNEVLAEMGRSLRTN